MLYLVIPFFRKHRIIAHNRTSHKKSSDDDYGGRSYRAAKTSLFHRVCFGCFVFYAFIEFSCRAPPTIRAFINQFENRRSKYVENFFEKIFRKVRCEATFHLYNGTRKGVLSDMKAAIHTTFERRIDMLFLLTRCKRTTVKELRYYFNVSRDTILRDLAFISRYAPIYTKQGMYGGVYVIEDYIDNLKLHLSSDEENLLNRLAKISNDTDAKLLRNIINKYSMPKNKV